MDPGGRPAGGDSAYPSTAAPWSADLDDEPTRLDRLGIAYDDPMNTPSLRVVTLEDPDRNRLIHRRLRYA